MKTGTVLKFNSHAYGFILEAGDARQEYFFHLSDVVGRKSLQPGDRVRFEAGPRKIGARNAPPAIQVELIEFPSSAVRR
jgi:cold shock CspA family protein